MTAKVLVSACLLGVKVRYDGTGAETAGECLQRWQAEGRLVTVCPEVAGGLPVPRPPAEIEHGSGEDVLDGRAVVRTATEDVSAAFVRGAEAALALVEEHGILVAVLKERSPSCGAGRIYDGTRTGGLKDGDGVTSALLKRHGVTVFGETRLSEADELLRQIDGANG